MRAAFLVLAAVLLFLPEPARAQSRRLKPPPRLAVTLTYERAPGLPQCPDERRLRLATRAELGYDPFVDEPAPLRFKLSVVHRGAKLAAVMELRDETGAVVHENHDIAVDHDCKLLIDTVGDTVGAWLYRPAEVEPCPTCPTCPPPPEPPPPPAPPAPPPPPSLPEAPPAPRNVSVHVGMDVLAHFAILPSPGLGPGFFVALRLRDPALSFELDGRTSWTLATTEEGGSPTRGSYFSGVLAVCTHVRFAFLCPTVGFGTARFAASPIAYAFYPGFGTLGARAGAELPLGERFALRTVLGVEALLGKLVLAHDGADLREAPFVAASVGLGMVARVW
jgi:hypothetical protein